MQRNFWTTNYSKKYLPAFPCPTCEEGTLKYDAKELKVIETEYSKAAHSHDEWDPDWVEAKFIAILECNRPTCGEIVVFSGDTFVDQVVDDDHGWAYEQRLRPKSVFPGIPIIFIHEDVPAGIQTEIELAFQLYWSDKGACASRLRTSVERILDDFKIPSTKSGGGYLSLNERIVEFKKIDPDHAETFDALRFVGNVGTHATELKQEALLDAFEIYEDTIDELFVKKKYKAKIDALKKKIIATKGKY